MKNRVRTIVYQLFMSFVMLWSFGMFPTIASAQTPEEMNKALQDLFGQAGVEMKKPAAQRRQEERDRIQKAREAASKIPPAANLEGAWRLTAHDKSLDLVLYETKGSSYAEKIYDGFVQDAVSNCVLPVNIRIPDRHPHPVVATYSTNRYYIQTDGGQITDHSKVYPELMTGNCGGGSEDVMAQSSLYGRLNLAADRQWSGKLAVNRRIDATQLEATLIPSTITPILREYLTTVKLTREGIPEKSIYASMAPKNNPFADKELQGKDAELVGELPTGGTYVEAIYRNLPNKVAVADRRFARLYVKAMTGEGNRAYQDLSSLLSGKGFLTERERAAMDEWVANQSLLPAAYVTYLFRYEDTFPQCMGPNPKSVHIPWVAITKTDYGFGVQSERVTSSNTIVHTVPERLYDRLVPISRADPYQAEASDRILNLMHGDKERLVVSDVTAATHAFMSKLSCNTPEKSQFEANLFSMYDKHNAAQNERMARANGHK
ncbi:hypothetical protein Q7C_1573 [Methylophaga frappieri]|jgi:hypothetical protein|uniref:Uncharacterized protein n=1 Tax=Methylophaga frappieri (strain ATCC BAA-2434 / DSM 25690 / JAM7) TaxID=754477 RepID=I1YIH9_METFJ|nr:hypothetical protein [Methylophaga frappieri]AFJ02722.1 hypothetical protein Q7C_1573 [Methylophaga frappieri]